MLLDEICGEDRTGGERMEMNCGDGNTKRGFHAGVGPTKQAFWAFGNVTASQSAVGRQVGIRFRGGSTKMTFFGSVSRAPGLPSPTWVKRTFDAAANKPRLI